MSLARRLIPCLDVAGGRVVKGVHFRDLKDAGDPVELAERYSREGADELVFLDITATVEDRQAALKWVRRVARSIFIPFTVGGGIKGLEDIRDLLRAGADKVSLNSAAVRDPDLIARAARQFGSQCVVVAVDAKRHGTGWRVFVRGGRTDTGLEALAWVQRAYELGAGEILLTSMDRDGTKSGYDIDLLQNVSTRIGCPLIASGGAGRPEDLVEAIEKGGADAVLVASLLHYGQCSVGGLKNFLAERGIPVRPVQENILNHGI